MPSPVTRHCLPALALALVLATAATGCAPPTPDPAAAIIGAVGSGLPRARLVVLRTLPHDTGAWTEGLEIAGGSLYESTGRTGHSQLRELDPNTGRLLRSADLPAPLYGEGITVLGPRVWQLTWQDHVALRWDLPALRASGQQPYPGEGWGLCHTSDGRVIASDGTDTLRVLAGDDLRPLGTVAVRAGGRPLTGLNELECVAGTVWANVYQTDWLVQINLATGKVVLAVDAGGLWPAAQRDDPSAEVLNGIASVPGTNQFLITGKLWPAMYRVRFTR